VILADTSIWVEHLREGDAELEKLLEHGQILTHPFVIGEIALGSLRRRDFILGALRGLPRTAVATDEEVMHLIEERALHSLGIGYVDAHLVAAAKLTPGTLLWTRDQRLRAACEKLRLGASER
jgi:predicted nucleic acid-binding protein